MFYVYVQSLSHLHPHPNRKTSRKPHLHPHPNIRRWWRRWWDRWGDGDADTNLINLSMRPQSRLCQLGELSNYK
jgi:hypothetical protein